MLVGQTRVRGHGVGADDDLGAGVAGEDVGEIQGAVDEMTIHQVEGRRRRDDDPPGRRVRDRRRPRRRDWQRVAVETKDAMAESRDRSRENRSALVTDDGDELQPLF